MARTGRPGLTPTQQQEIWQRWQAGESLSDTARALGKQPGSIRRVVVALGGIAPPPRTRSRLALTAMERETISRGLAAGASLREMAHALGRAPSTISRETRRHGGRAAYRAVVADAHAWDRALRPKCCRLAGHLRLRRLVAGKLRLRWSPEQIAGWLGHTFPAKTSLHLSHETIGSISGVWRQHNLHAQTHAAAHGADSLGPTAGRTSRTSLSHLPERQGAWSPRAY